MKQRRVELALAALTALFAAFCLGFFLGRNTVPQTITTETERPQTQTAALPAAQPEEQTAQPEQPEQPEQSEQVEEPLQSGQPVNINTASAETLDTLPGISPVLAQRIVDWRAQYGAFSSVEQLTDVPGIGEAKLEKIRAMITVEE